MYESKLGIEKETDLAQIKAPKKSKKLEQRPRVEEKEVMTRKKVEYKAVHQRLSDSIGDYEETSY